MGNLFSVSLFHPCHSHCFLPSSSLFSSLLSLPSPPLLNPPSLPFLPPRSLKPPHNAGTLLDNQDVHVESTASTSAFVQLLSSEGGKAVFSEDAKALRCRTNGQMLSQEWHGCLREHCHSLFGHLSTLSPAGNPHRGSLLPTVRSWCPISVLCRWAG